MSPAGRWNTVGKPYFSSFHRFSGISGSMLQPVFGLNFDPNLEYAVTSEQSYFHSDSWGQQRYTRKGHYFDHHLKCLSSELVFFHAQLIASCIASKTKLPNYWTHQVANVRERFDPVF